MKYAISDDQKIEASPGVTGACPHCGAPMIAKCGRVRVPHWAHRTTRMCDTWWENETEWHRSWKNEFPADWQEVSLTHRLTGEKHIADVRTPNGLTIEFQHSAISLETILEREAFYKRMIWVFDGLRRKTDLVRFREGVSWPANLPPRAEVDLHFFPDARSHFHADWLESRKLIFIDFRGFATPDANDILRSSLWCLVPLKGGDTARVVSMPRDIFVRHCIENTLFEAVKKTLARAPELARRLSAKREFERRRAFAPRLSEFHKYLARREARRRRRLPL